MQDKIKYVLMALVGFAMLFGIVFLVLKVKSLEREGKELQGQNTNLNQQVATITADNANLEKKIGSLTKDLEAASTQRTEIQSKFDLLVQERDALINQIKAEKERAEKESVPVKQTAVPSGMEDSYFANILKQKADLEVKLSMMRDTFKELKAANDQLVLEKNNLALEANTLSRDSQDIQRTSEYNQKMVDALTRELAGEKTNNLELAKRLKAIKAENRQLRQQIQSLGERRLSLEKRLTDTQNKNAGLESSLASMELYVKQQMFKMDDIKNQMQDVRGGDKPVSNRGTAGAQPSYQQSTAAGQRREAIQLPPIVVRPQQNASPDQPTLGNQSKIISIDKENNFVVVNAGQANNLKIGDTFQVSRDGQNIGTVEVIQARERIAACDIKEEKTPLRVGDLIR
jgi:chromosome segregation ATPase